MTSDHISASEPDAPGALFGLPSDVANSDPSFHTSVKSYRAPGALILPNARLYDDGAFANVAYVGNRMLVIDAACYGTVYWSSWMDFSFQHITVVVPSSC